MPTPLLSGSPGRAASLRCVTTLGTIDRDGDRATWTFRNDRDDVVVVVFEPYGDEILVPRGSTLAVTAWGGKQPPDGSTPLLVLPEGMRVVVWCQWPESYGAAHLDGLEI